MPDRETIESTLRRVHSGDLSPDAATELLLQAESNDHAGESLASLIDRLGTPPSDIVETWRQQMRGVACQYEQQTGQPLPSIDRDDWSITSAGDLSWQGQSDQERLSKSQPSARSIEQIDQFFSSLTAEPAPVTEAPASTIATDLEPSQTVTQGSAEPKPGRFAATALRSAVVFALLVAILAGAWIVHQATQAGSESLANIDTPPPAPIDAASIDSNPSLELAGPSGEPAAELETLESLEAVEQPSPDSPALDLELTVPLDQLMPLSIADHDAGAEGDELTSDEAATDQGKTEIRSATVAEMLADDDAEPVESPQATRAAAIGAVALHDMDETAQATHLPIDSLQALKLEFPFDAPLRMSGEGLAWVIHDRRSDAAIAAIDREADETRFRWIDAAQKSPAATTLIHGRISNQVGDAVFLRPVIEADPWPFRLDQPDVMPIWNLGQPIPPRASRIAVDFDLPDSIDLAWIEPIDAESLRRTRGVAVLTPKDGETVALGIRFDVRCARKLTCRVRYAGRLDPSLPWQILSNSQLEQFGNQLADQAAAVSMESARLDRVYQIADSSGRRILRIKQDRTDNLAEMISTTAKRVAQLQGLIAALEAEGSLKLRVWVEWPTTEQDLLSMERGDESDHGDPALSGN